MSDLERACEIITEEIDWEDRPEEIETPLGTHGCWYPHHKPEDSTDADTWVVIGLTLPGGLMAEIGGGTYGHLQGIRYYPFR